MSISKCIPLLRYASTTSSHQCSRVIGSSLLTAESFSCVPSAILSQLRNENRCHFSSSAADGVSLDLLKELRSLSGAPIVDCKKALSSVGGTDLNAALDWLREHGASKASSKVQGRATTEGLVGLKISDDGTQAGLVKVASETDFASRSRMFVDLVLNVTETALGCPGDGIARRIPPDALLDMNVPMTGSPSSNLLASSGNMGGEKTVKGFLNEAIVAIRENLSVAEAHHFKATDTGLLVGYIHNRIDGSDAGTAAAIVHVSPESGAHVESDVLQSVGKKLAMHIVAARPMYLTPNHVPEDHLAKEKDLLTRQMSTSGKPADVVEKIVQGRLRKFMEGLCLTEQSHMIEEQNPPVKKVLQDHKMTIQHFEALAIN